MQKDDPLEILKVKKENAHVYKMPPMSTSEGHMVDDFKELIFRGDIKITIRGEQCIVYFINPDSSVFLVSIIDENIDKHIIRAVGSTRYFTLRAMTPEGIPGYYGVGMYITM